MHPARQKIVREVANLSSGTMTSVTNINDMEKIDKLQYALTEFTISTEPIYENWNQAWRAFLNLYGIKYNDKGVAENIETIFNTVYISQLECNDILI
jgi:hypothetical protein